MHFNSFLKLVEIRTKLASLVPFLLGTSYALYRFNKFNLVNFLLMSGSLLFIDMTTTALNNYFDYKRAHRKHGYNYESHNAIIRDRLNEKTVLAVILAMLLSAAALGIILAAYTNVVVFIIGVVSFAVGICYSFGPVPISRTPLGEIFSGFFMGFIIVFLSIYIHVYNLDVISLAIQKNNLIIQLNIIELLNIFLLAFPLICGIANIMLANNICDIEDDRENKRFTLPIYVGKEKALLLYSFIYYAAYADIVLLCLLKIIPLLCLTVLLTLIPVSKNISMFRAQQTKKDTFALSVKNFFMMSVPLLSLILLVFVLGG